MPRRAAASRAAAATSAGEDRVAHAAERRGPPPHRGACRQGAAGARQRGDRRLQAARGRQIAPQQVEPFGFVVALGLASLLTGRHGRRDLALKAAAPASGALDPLIEARHHARLARLVEPPRGLARRNVPKQRSGAEKVEHGAARERRPGRRSQAVRQAREHARPGRAVRQAARHRQAGGGERRGDASGVLPVRHDHGALPRPGAGAHGLHDRAHRLAPLAALVGHRNDRQAPVAGERCQGGRAGPRRAPDGGQPIDVSGRLRRRDPRRRAAGGERESSMPPLAAASVAGVTAGSSVAGVAALVSRGPGRGLAAARHRYEGVRAGVQQRGRRAPS